jgi:hypothetical protein
MVSPCELEEDLEGETFRAAPLEQIGRPVQVDVVPRSETSRVARAEACALELVLAPALHSIELVLLPDWGLES